MGVRPQVGCVDKMGLTPIAYAVIFGRAKVVQKLVARGAVISPNEDGINVVHLACVFNAGAEVVRALVESKADINARIRPVKFGIVWSAMSALTIRYRLGGRSFLPLASYHSWGATPCMLAVMYVNGGEKQACRLVNHHSSPLPPFVPTGM